MSLLREVETYGGYIDHTPQTEGTANVNLDKLFPIPPNNMFHIDQLHTGYICRCIEADREPRGQPLPRNSERQPRREVGGDQYADEAPPSIGLVAVAT